MAQSVFITGGTGFIGQAVIGALLARGDRVSVLSRNSASAQAALGDGPSYIEADPSTPGAWQDRVAGHSAVINLAGQSIAGKRWNARYRQLLLDSRVETTHFVVDAIAAAPVAERPKVLLSASGIDYYPFDVDLDEAGIADLDDDVDVTESARPGDSFLARVCRKWEEEALRARRNDTRVVCLRTGVVLDRAGGPLAQIVKPFKLLVGGRLSHGRQWFSWIHRVDAVAAILFALDHDTIRGPLNLVAPQPVRNRELTRTLARVLRRPALAPVPAFALKLALGEFHEYLINGRRAVPAALLAAGFEFEYPELEPALRAGTAAPA
jgi:hypothetical protein